MSFEILNLNNSLGEIIYLTVDKRGKVTCALIKVNQSMSDM